jgi:hypothetical protein
MLSAFNPEERLHATQLDGHVLEAPNLGPNYIRWPI